MVLSYPLFLSHKNSQHKTPSYHSRQVMYFNIKTRKKTRNVINLNTTPLCQACLRYINFTEKRLLIIFWYSDQFILYLPFLFITTSGLSIGSSYARRSQFLRALTGISEAVSTDSICFIFFKRSFVPLNAASALSR